MFLSEKLLNVCFLVTSCLEFIVFLTNKRDREKLTHESSRLTIKIPSQDYTIFSVRTFHLQDKVKLICPFESTFS